MKKSIRELRQECDALESEARELIERAGDSDLEGNDAERFDELTHELDQVREELRKGERRMAEVRNLATNPRNVVPGSDVNERTVRNSTPKKSLSGLQLLTRDQSVETWGRDNGYATAESEGASFDKFIRGIVTRDWQGAEQERALAEGTLSAGGYLVPTPLASNVIDLVRNQAVVVQAGAQTIPMTSQTLKVPRLTGEGTPAWRNENAAISAQDLTFDAVTFTARSLARMVIMSRELFEDSDPAASGIISKSFANQIAVELDRVALRGSGTPPEPRGVLNTSGITTTTHGANGAAVTYDFLLDAAGTVLANGYMPSAHVVAPRSLVSLAKAKDSQGNYLTAPAGLLPILPTRQVPVNNTVGTSTDTSEVYTGQWNMLAIGIRTGFEIRFLQERYADNNQVAFLATMRADVQLLQPAAFVVDTGVRG
ncbi:phage major capsid protein [Rhodococcus sp. IEGM 1351]|uniref:phage major capsid protein n=1 Tax=Rhodococcus sp. IEGM 1351 TaxID=3047089 RepID=UPI0024B6A85B|nr:phage major capsid protein [Rhodococcus sp. IEGM 1351]MDI9936587.1 phage major capsid protein [Rhodococcus sp. IEGM 1351]